MGADYWVINAGHPDKGWPNFLAGANVNSQVLLEIFHGLEMNLNLHKLGQS